LQILDRKNERLLPTAVQAKLPQGLEGSGLERLGGHGR
jgi:hypothetical protein